MMCESLLTGELKARREALGWSLQELGERCAIDEQFLVEWERGLGSPRLDAVAAWASALGLKLALAPAAESGRRGVEIDWQSRCVSVEGAPVRLTPMEWSALERLAKTPGELVTHEELFRHLYGDDRPYSAQSTAIRVLITKLRRLLPLRIEAQWGRGYVVKDVRSSSEADGRGRTAAEPIRTAIPAMHRHVAGGTAPSVSSARLLQQIVQRANPPPRRADRAAPPPNQHRAEELQVIERFLAERGATRCPDVAAIQAAPLPTLVWDKIKRKWVRPSLADLAAG